MSESVASAYLRVRDAIPREAGVIISSADRDLICSVIEAADRVVAAGNLHGDTFGNRKRAEARTALWLAMEHVHGR